MEEGLWHANESCNSTISEDFDNKEIWKTDCVYSLFVCPSNTSWEAFDEHLAHVDMTIPTCQHKGRVPIHVLRYLFAIMASIEKESL